MSKHTREDASKPIVSFYNDVARGKVEVYCKLFYEAKNEKTNGIFRIATS